jgi:hypothetical protein
MTAPTWYANSSTTVSSAMRYAVVAFAQLLTKRFHPIGNSLIRCGPWRDAAARPSVLEFYVATMDGTKRSRERRRK